MITNDAKSTLSEEDFDVWEVFCDWILAHKHLRRLVIKQLSLNRMQTKYLKSSLKNSKAPIVEVDLS